MARRPKYLAWIDLETTGSDEWTIGAQILEIGWVITKNEPGFPMIEGAMGRLGTSGNQVFYLKDKDWPNRADLVVQKMHTTNGLWEEAARSIMPVEVFDAYFGDELMKLDKGNHIGLAGSGVAHFDRRWIKEFMPETDNALTHYAYDVGVLRRFFAVAGSGSNENPKNLSHRALGDALDHLEEARQYVDMLKMFGQGW